MKMKKLLTAFAVCFLLALLAGCGTKEPEESVAVCFVLGAHNNFPVVNVSQFYTDVYDACYSYGSAAAVAVSGSSQVAVNYDITPPSIRVDADKRRQLAGASTATVLRTLQAVSADAPEVDTLGAIMLGRDLLVKKDASQKVLVIVDSMLSTTPLLDFSSSNLIEQDPEEIVAQLEQRHAIPDLSGIKVRVMGLGQVCGDQLPLTADYAYRLREIWTAILQTSCCLSLEIDPTPLGGTAPKDLPYVSTVPVVADALSFSEAAAMPDVIRFDETAIKFSGDSAEFSEPDRARETLLPIADVLQDAPETKIVLAGMTASVGDDGVALSLARAEAVKSVLAEAGANPTYITCIGLGRRNNCLRVNDLDDNGCLVEEYAKLNRAVFLFLKNSPTAEALEVSTSE